MAESLLKVNIKDIKTKSVGIGLVSLLLTLNKLKPIDASITLSEALQKKSQFFSSLIWRSSPSKSVLISPLKLRFTP